MLSDENERGERRIHEGAGTCLHCRIWDAIIDYHEAAGLMNGDQPLYDTRIILGNVGDVLAEMLASLPDRNERRRALQMFNDHVRVKTAEYINSGNHPEAIKMREH